MNTKNNLSVTKKLKEHTVSSNDNNVEQKTEKKFLLIPYKMEAKLKEHYDCKQERESPPWNQNRSGSLHFGCFWKTSQQIY